MKPNDVSRRHKRMSLSTVSKAADKSRRTSSDILAPAKKIRRTLVEQHFRWNDVDDMRTDFQEEDCDDLNDPAEHETFQKLGEHRELGR